MSVCVCGGTLSCGVMYPVRRCKFILTHYYGQKRINVLVVELGKKPRVRPSHRQEDNINMYLRKYDERDPSGLGWGQVYTVTNILVP